MRITISYLAVIPTVKVTLDGYPFPIELAADTEILYANTRQEELAMSNTCLQIPPLQEEAGTISAKPHTLPEA